MHSGLFETVNAIFWVVLFIAAGGTAALIFIVVFAQSISGLKSLQKQTQHLQKQFERLNDTLEKISEKINKDHNRSNNSG
jgi:peptidoglycan hydrolase CwlO-like protein